MPEVQLNTDQAIKYSVEWMQEQYAMIFREYAGVPLWAWVAIPCMLLTAYLIALFLTHIIRQLTKRFRNGGNSRKLKVSEVIYTARMPIRLLITFVLFSWTKHLLPLTKGTEKTISYVELSLMTLIVVLGAYRVMDAVSDHMRRVLTDTGRASAATVIPLMRRIGKTLVAFFALLFWLQNFGFDVAAIIAGLGIGGLAVALAGQKTIENLFGGIMLVLDQPVKVGDFCRFGDKMGIVEDVGLRSTRIRTLDRTLVTVPNADFSQMQIENFASRDRIWLNKTIGLVYSTKASQLRAIVAETTDYLKQHPRMDPSSVRVRFINLGDYALQLEIFAYADCKDWGEYLGIQEEILLSIMDIVERNGSAFAFPTQTMVMENHLTEQGMGQSLLPEGKAAAAAKPAPAPRHPD
jgi:MscS family membrane protein